MVPLPEVVVSLGMNSNTIRRGWRELDDELQQQPVERIRHQGGGRLPIEKNEQRLTA